MYALEGWYGMNFFEKGLLGQTLLKYIDSQIRKYKICSGR